MKFAVSLNDDGPFDGGCPCCLIHGDGFEVEVRCWRGDGRSHIAVSGALDIETRRRIAKHIRDHNGWTYHSGWVLEVV
jgi:hypothetical protein